MPACHEVRTRQRRRRRSLVGASFAHATRGAHQCRRWFGCMSPHLNVQSLAHFLHAGLACAGGKRCVSACKARRACSRPAPRCPGRNRDASERVPHDCAAQQRRAAVGAASEARAATHAPRCAARHWSESCLYRERFPELRESRELPPPVPPRWANSCPSPDRGGAKRSKAQNELRSIVRACLRAKDECKASACLKGTALHGVNRPAPTRERDRD